MLLLSNLSNPLLLIGIVISLLVAITIHEYSHAWVANFYGDSTAKSMGRLSLNPLAHLDLWGTIFLLVAGFGWGKPVIVNPNNFKNPKFDNLTVALSGPISNLLLATVLGLLYRFIPLTGYFQVFFVLIIFYNLALMIFNLIPIPPLDGSKILGLILSEENFLRFQQFGIGLLFFIIIISYFFPGLFTSLFKIVSFFFTLITNKPIVF